MFRIDVALFTVQLTEHESVAPLPMYCRDISIKRDAAEYLTCVSEQ